MTQIRIESQRTLYSDPEKPDRERRGLSMTFAGKFLATASAVTFISLLALGFGAPAFAEDLSDNETCMECHEDADRAPPSNPDRPQVHNPAGDSSWKTTTCGPVLTATVTSLKSRMQRKWPTWRWTAPTVTRKRQPSDTVNPPAGGRRAPPRRGFFVIFQKVASPNIFLEQVYRKNIHKRQLISD